MGHGQVMTRTGLLVILALGVAMPATVAGQSAAKSDDATWTLPRTPDGHPDLQGVWANNNATPLERPEAWTGKDRLTPEELAELKIAAQQAVADGDALFGDQLVLGGDRADAGRVLRPDDRKLQSVLGRRPRLQRPHLHCD